MNDILKSESESENTPKLLSIADYAKKMNVTKQTIYRKVKENELNVKVIDNKKFIILDKKSENIKSKVNESNVNQSESEILKKSERNINDNVKIIDKKYFKTLTSTIKQQKREIKELKKMLKKSERKLTKSENNIKMLNEKLINDVKELNQQIINEKNESLTLLKQYIGEIKSLEHKVNSDVIDDSADIEIIKEKKDKKKKKKNKGKKKKD